MVYLLKSAFSFPVQNKPKVCSFMGEMFLSKKSSGIFPSFPEVASPRISPPLGAPCDSFFLCNLQEVSLGNVTCSGQEIPQNRWRVQNRKLLFHKNHPKKNKVLKVVSKTQKKRLTNSLGAPTKKHPALEVATVGQVLENQGFWLSAVAEKLEHLESKKTGTNIHNKWHLIGFLNAAAYTYHAINLPKIGHYISSHQCGPRLKDHNSISLNIRWYDVDIWEVGRLSMSFPDTKKQVEKPHWCRA